MLPGLDVDQVHKVTPVCLSELHGQKLSGRSKSANQRLGPREGPDSHRRSKSLWLNTNFSLLCMAFLSSRACHICNCCCDQVLVKVGAIKALTSVLERIGIKYTIYDGVEPNPTIEQVSMQPPALHCLSPPCISLWSVWMLSNFSPLPDRCQNSERSTQYFAHILLLVTCSARYATQLYNCKPAKPTL